MFRHLTNVRGIVIEDKGNGIYYLKGDPIPMQLLLTPKLSEKENYWLISRHCRSMTVPVGCPLVQARRSASGRIAQNLSTNLKAGAEIRSLVARYEKHKHSKDYEAVMDLITRANWKEMEVERKMCDALKELLSDELQEANARGKSEGRSEGRSEGITLAKQVFKLSAQGVQPAAIAEKCGISLDQVMEILE